MLARLLSTILRRLLRQTMELTREAREAPYRTLVHEVMSALMTHPIPEPPGLPTRFTPEEMAQQEEEAAHTQGTLEQLQDPFSWQGLLKSMLRLKFKKKALSEDERSSRADLRTLVDMPLVVDRLCTQCGLKISRAARHAFEQDPRAFHLLRFDVRKISVRVRHMNVVDEAEAHLLLQETTLQGTVRPGLWEAISARFARAVGSHTTSDRLLLRWGYMLLEQCASLPLGAMEGNQERVRRSIELLDQAHEKFQRAEALEETNPEMRWGKGQVQVIRAAVFMAWATSDTLSYQQWLLQSAVVEFRALFESQELFFQRATDTANALYQQASQTTDACKKAFLFLHTHLLLYCCLQVAPTLPSSALFFQAGAAAVEYLHCEMKRVPLGPVPSQPTPALSHGPASSLRRSQTLQYDRKQESKSAGSRQIPGWKRTRNHSELRAAPQTSLGLSGDLVTHAAQAYLLAASGLLFEAALMQVGCLSDGPFLYSFADECRLQSANYASRYQTDRAVPIDIRQAGDAQHEVHSTVALASTTRLLLTPLISKSPESSLQVADSKNKLLSALILGQVSRDSPSWPVPREFTLALPHYHAFVVNRIALCVSTGTGAGASPITVRLQASTTERISFPRSHSSSLSSPRKAPPSAREHTESVSAASVGGGGGEDSEREDDGLGTSFPLCDTITLQDGQEFTLDLSSDPRPIRYVGVRLHAAGRAPVQLHGLHLYGMLVDQPPESSHVPRPVRLPIKPGGDYRPRAVQWIQEASHLKTSISPETHSFTLSSSHTTRRVPTDTVTCTVRASPAWTLHEDPEASSLCQQEDLPPVLLYLDASAPPHEAREAVLDVARQTYAAAHPHSSQRLSIERHADFASVKAWVEACEPVRLRHLLTRGALRLLVGHVEAQRSLKRKMDAVSSLLLELEEERHIDPNYLLVLFAPDTSRRRALHQGMMWVAETDQHMVDFAAMRWSSHTLHFDPCGLFLQEKTLRRSKRRMVHAVLSPLQRVHRSYRGGSSSSSSSGASTTPTTTPNHSSSHSGEEGAGGARHETAFIYFEVRLPREVNEWAVGVTPHNFDVNRYLPGEVLGSYGWHSGGQLRCNMREVEFEGQQNVRARGGDMVGCGYNWETKSIFWTHNGQYLGTAEGRQAVASEHTIEYLFPSVGFRGLTSRQGVRVEANFGEAPFLFPSHLLEDAVQTEKFAMRASQQDIPQLMASFLGPCGDNQRLDLLLLAEIAQHSFGFQALLKAHFAHRQTLARHRTLRRYHTLHLAQCAWMRDRHLARACQLFAQLVHVDLSHSSRLSSHFLAHMPDVFARVHTLNLEGLDLDEETARLLVRHCPRLQGLRPWQSLSDSALLLLADLGHLRDLELMSCPHLTDGGLKAFLGRPLALRALTFYECMGLGRGTLKALSKSSTAKSLQKLRLECCPRFFANERGIFKRLFQQCGALVAVSFAGCSDHPSAVGDEPLQYLCQRHGSQLQALSLDYCPKLTAEGLQAVVAHCDQLRELNVGHLRPQVLTDTVLAQLAGSSFHLQRLELVDTPLRDDGLRLFATQQPNLRQLSLQRCSITWDGVMQALPYWTELTFLSLKETCVSTDLLYYRMAEPGVLPSLRVLDLRRTSEPPGFNPSDSQYALDSLKSARPHWLIFPRDATEMNFPSLHFHHVNESTLRFPPSKISSMRLRKNRV